jgi:hypothetical protein
MAHSLAVNIRDAMPNASIIEDPPGRAAPDAAVSDFSVSAF